MSVNASDRLENGFIGSDYHRHDPICDGFLHDADYYVDFKPNNAPASGVNPTQSIKKAISK